MLRITLVAQTADEVLLKLEGWIEPEDVVVLEQEGTRWLGQQKRLVLDMAQVKSIDRAGLQLLQGWAGERLEVQHSSPYVHELLQTYGVVE
jgi:ABC-type transporter Mla MlaB component